MSANPHANGGLLRKALRLPDFQDFAFTVTKPGTSEVGPTEVLAHFLAETMRRNMESFRVFGPDETASNKLQAIYEASKKTWLAEYLAGRSGRRRACLGRPRHGDAERTHAGGMVRGLCPDRAARPVRQLRGVCSRHRFHVQPACQVAGEV